MFGKTMKVVLFLSLSGTVFNASSAIVYQSDNRYIDHTKATGGPFTPATPYADFNENWWAFEAGAFQTTTVNATSMSGSGYTYAGSDAMLYGAEGTSKFSVNFGVDELTDFSLTGSLDSALFGGSTLYVSLLQDGIKIFGFDTWDFLVDGVNPFNYSGQFSVGSNYELVLFSSTYDSYYYNEKWQFNLATTPAVPVPAAVWLFGSGLLGLVGVARRKVK